MRYYSLKTVEEINGKNENRLYVVKDESLISSCNTVMLVVSPVDLINSTLLKYVYVFDDEEKESYYEVKIEYDTIEGKVIKEVYLQAANSTAEAEESIKNNLADMDGFEITNTNKKNYASFISTVKK